MRLLSVAFTVCLMAGCGEKTETEAEQVNPISQLEASDSAVDRSANVNDAKKLTVVPKQVPPNAVSGKPPISPLKGIAMYQGTVRFLNLEGGFWGIMADNGQRILPQNLPTEFKQDGLRISFKATEITGMMTIQQWGTLSKLSDINVIGKVEGKAQDPLN